MNIIGIIPARYQSSRFPGKPLAMIYDKSMIQRVYEQATNASSLLSVVVATDDERIFEHVVSFGGHAVMTSEKHNTGTERCLEASRKLYPSIKFDVILNIQGDEPLIAPDLIDCLCSEFAKKNTQIATMAKVLKNMEDVKNPNVVKLVMNNNNRALYFSRFAIPYIRNSKDNYSNFYQHIGIYAYRKDILNKICKLKPTALEQAESLEQLRWLENGYSINVGITDTESLAVDVPDDILKVEAYIRKHNL